MSDDDQPKAIRIDSWGFETGPRGGNGVPLIGIFLIVFGLLLVAGQIFTVAAISASALFLALGVVLILKGVRDGVVGAALFIGIFVAGIALSDLLSAPGVGIIHGGGWGLLFVGIGLLAAVPLRAGRHRGWVAPLIVGALFCVLGGSEIVTSYLNLDLERLVGPALLVLLGIWLVTRNRR
jgi:hypothetical protein